MRESPQETLSRLGPYPRYPDFCTIQVDQRKGGFEAKNKLSTDFHSAINCVPERSLLGAFGKQHHDYDHDVFNSAGSTLATPHFGPENGVHLTQRNTNFVFNRSKKGSAPCGKVEKEDDGKYLKEPELAPEVILTELRTVVGK